MLNRKAPETKQTAGSIGGEQAGDGVIDLVKASACRGLSENSVGPRWKSLQHKPAPLPWAAWRPVLI